MENNPCSEQELFQILHRLLNRKEARLSMSMEAALKSQGYIRRKRGKLELTNAGREQHDELLKRI